LGGDVTGSSGAEIVPQVKGNTLRVYVYLLKHGLSELREVQRGVGLSTPSLASYHLGRLVEFGYVQQNEHGQYQAIRDASTELLEGYTKVGSVLVPQLLFFSVFFTALVAYFVLASIYSSAYVPFLAASSVGLVAVVWYETVRVWRRLTSWK